MEKTLPKAAIPLYRPLDDTDIRKIVAEAFHILGRRGLHVYSVAAREAFAETGAEIDTDSGRVRLSKALLEDVIDSTPSTVTLFSRDGKHDACLGGGEVYCGTGGTAIYVLDPDTEARRPSVVEDLILNARLIQALDCIDVATINVFPSEIESKDEIDVNRFFHFLDHMTKHVMGGVYSMEGTRKVVEMASMIAGGSEALRAKPFVSFITLVVSPLRIDGHYGDIACYLAREGLPVVMPTMPICGLTSPITLASNILMCVAETLGGVALIQAVRRGSPVICGSVGTIMNLRTMRHVGGAVERAMIQAAVAQVAQYLKLPLYSTAGTTDAKEVDVQAAYESAISNLLVVMSGADYIHDSAGLLESELTVSYEKLVVDNEIVGMCQRVRRGIEVNDETLAVDLILDKGPADHFAAEEHTLLHMQGAYFEPKLANREVREKMEAGEDALGRARRFIRDIRERAPESVLDGETRRQIIENFPEIRFS